MTLVGANSIFSPRDRLVKALLSICLLFSTNTLAQISGGLPPIQRTVPSPTARPPEIRVTPNPVTQPKPDETLRSIQEALNRRGYDAGYPDGFMGPQTHSAVLTAERALGLPITGIPNPTLLSILNRNIESVDSADRVELLEDRRNLKYSERVAKYRKAIGRSLPEVRAVLSGELDKPGFPFSQIAKKVEEAQTWWDAGSEVNMVFHNSTSKPLSGLVLKITAGDCNGGGKNQFRFITFASEVKPNQVVAAYFSWDGFLPRDWRCIDIVDVIFK
jgi:hypothetical protein